MKVYMLTIAVVSIAVYTPCAFAEPKDDKVTIQGTWNVISVESRDEKEKGDSDFQVVFTKNKMIMRLNGKDFLEASYKLDPKKKPKWIDFTETKKYDIKGTKQKDGPNARGIYDLADDALKLCFTPEDKKEERPQAFATKRELPATTMMVLKRVKP